MIRRERERERYLKLPTRVLLQLEVRWINYTLNPDFRNMGQRLMSSDDKTATFDFATDEPRLNLTNSRTVTGSTPVPQSSIQEQRSWPRSYERSMSFYSGSPPVDDSGFLFRQSSIPDVKAPLLHDPYAHDKLEDNDERPSHPYAQFLRQLSSHSDLANSNVASYNELPKASQSSFFQATLNGVNTLAGVGVLSMPYAVAQGGWIGLGILLVFAAVCCYTGVLLRRCIDLEPSIQTYPDVGQAAFGKLGRFLISCMLYLDLFSVAIEFLILEGDNLTQLVSWGGIDIGFLSLSSNQSFVVIAAVVMLPTVWLRNLSLLSYVSAGGVVACIALLIAVAWTAIFDTGLKLQGRVLNVQGFPIAIGLYAFCYSGHPVFPSIYSSMRDKTKFSHVLVVSFIVCTLIYGGMAVLGFFMYGDSIESQVTLNLPTGQVITKIAILATIVNPFAKYALTLTPVAAAVEELLPGTWAPRNLVMCGTVLRTLLVVSTVVIALAIPFFAYLMALVGSFLSTSMAITIPCMCYLKLFSGKISRWETGYLVVFLVIGIASCVVGTYSAVLELVKSYN